MVGRLVVGAWLFGLLNVNGVIGGATFYTSTRKSQKYSMANGDQKIGGRGGDELSGYVSALVSGQCWWVIGWLVCWYVVGYVCQKILCLSGCVQVCGSTLTRD